MPFTLFRYAVHNFHFSHIVPSFHMSLFPPISQIPVDSLSVSGESHSGTVVAPRNPQTYLQFRIFICLFGWLELFLEPPRGLQFWQPPGTQLSWSFLACCLWIVIFSFVSLLTLVLRFCFFSCPCLMCLLIFPCNNNDNDNIVLFNSFPFKRKKINYLYFTWYSVS